MTRSKKCVECGKHHDTVPSAMASCLTCRITLCLCCALEHDHVLEDDELYQALYRSLRIVSRLMARRGRRCLDATPSKRCRLPQGHGGSRHRWWPDDENSLDAEAEIRRSGQRLQSVSWGERS